MENNVPQETRAVPEPNSDSTVDVVPAVVQDVEIIPKDSGTDSDTPDLGTPNPVPTPENAPTTGPTPESAVIPSADPAVGSVVRPVTGSPPVAESGHRAP